MPSWCGIRRSNISLPIAQPALSKGDMIAASCSNHCLLGLCDIAGGVLEGGDFAASRTDDLRGVWRSGYDPGDVSLYEQTMKEHDAYSDCGAAIRTRTSEEWSSSSMVTVFFMKIRLSGRIMMPVTYH